MYRIKILLCISTLFLVGCDEVLYEQLPQQEANEMLALLLGNEIQAYKTIESSGSVTLHVEAGQFSRAIQILHQHGYPKSRQMTFDQLFPSGQLVTSPSQEQAKLIFFKEQQLENMFDQIDGVITSRVSIAVCSPEQGCKKDTPPTASIFIKHSPEINMVQYQGQIRSLVQHSIQHIDYQDISVVLFPAKYQYVTVQDDFENLILPEQSSSVSLNFKFTFEQFIVWLQSNVVFITILLGVIAAITVLSIVFLLRRPSKTA